MEINDVGRVAHLGCVQADVGAVKMKACQVVGKAYACIAAHDDEVLIESGNTRGQIADPDITAVRI